LEDDIVVVVVVVDVMLVDVEIVVVVITGFTSFPDLLVVVVVVVVGLLVQSPTEAVHSVTPTAQTSTALHDTPTIISSNAAQHFFLVLNNMRGAKSARSQSEG
jgi:hypothetical protein